MAVIQFQSAGKGQPVPAFTRPRRAQPRWWRRRWFKIVLSLVVIGIAASFAITEYLYRHREHLLGDLEPLIRQRVIETLSARFNSPVELDHIDVSVANGVQVFGEGLRVERIAGTGGPSASENAPMLAINKFSFHTEMKNLLHSPTRIGAVTVQGMGLHIPPANQRRNLLGPNQHAEPADPEDPSVQPKIALLVDNIACQDVKLYIESSRAGKDPLEFDIQELQLRDVGARQPFSYQAKLINPRPVGNIRSTGHFGPWAMDDPGETPLDGSYSFDHADLDTIRGLGGILSSTGQFKGVLDKITVDGVTDTPNFSLDVSDHPVALHTRFHATVDGTSGDTYLDPVQAHLLHSDFTARGKVVRVKGRGHDITLDVNMPNARIEDMLRLGVKTSPTLMNGALTMRTRLHIPPGDVRLPAKLEMAGNFTVQQVKFNNPQFQDRVDGLSVRALGRPKDVQQVSTDHEAEVRSQMQANFSLGHGLMTVNDLHYQIPGALVLMNGVYSLDGNVFEFKGHVRTEATASQMVTGWKSWLLKPVDRFLKKDNAGLELPIAVSGTQGDVHVGLAMHGAADETTAQMATDLKGRKQAILDAAKAKRELEKAQKQQGKAISSTGGKRARAERNAQKDQEKAERREAAVAAGR